MTNGIDQEHIGNAAKAKQLYLDSLSADSGASDWHFAIRQARGVVSSALRASGLLSEVAKALEENGGHMLALRHLMAPPISQDQFRLLCPTWPKQSEKRSSSLTREQAFEAAKIFEEWRDPTVGNWLKEGKNPTRSQIRRTLQRAAVLIASQRVATARRTRLANDQELAVVTLLQSEDWKKLPSKSIDNKGDVPAKHFMHKTRFATKTTTHQEVDIACGLNGSYVVAMECKVTNDETNSVKRVNDVLKKATAWKDHWGSFVVTVALLQGVIAAKDVQRLTDANVLVFWSHDLDKFMNWLNSRI